MLVTGAGALALRLAAMIGESGRLADSVDAPGLVLLVADWIVSPADHARWLNRDIPHLPIVLGDRGVTVGPFVEPGSGPCLHCVHLSRTDDDPAWPVLATQLWGRATPGDRQRPAGRGDRLRLPADRRSGRGSGCAPGPELASGPGRDAQRTAVVPAPGMLVRSS